MASNYKLFKVPPKILKVLTGDEKKIIPILIEACKKVDKVYLLQKNDKFLGANFYPHDISKEKLEEAAKSSSRIFASCTIVEEDKSGNLNAIDYHLKYAKNLNEIASLIKKASEISKNSSFKNYLQTLSESLSDGSYEKADIAWLQVKNCNIDFTLGPFEREIDKLFGAKKAFQAHLAIINKPRTKQAEKIKNILFINPGPRFHNTSNSNVQVQVQDVIIFAGLIGDSIYSREHLPTDYETREKYGSKIIGYITTMDLKFEKLILPIFNAAFEKNFRERYSQEVLRKGNYFHALFYGLARQLHKYPGAQERLKELYPVFDQANNLVSGIQHTKHLILKGVINQKELEATMITQICWMFSEWLNRGIKVRESTLKGDALALRFLMETGAIQEKDGISWPNFAKMFFEIENLASIFSRFLEEASYSEAKEFLDKHLDLDIFEVFDKRLSKIKPF